MIRVILSLSERSTPTSTNPPISEAQEILWVRECKLMNRQKRCEMLSSGHSTAVAHMNARQL